MSKMRRPTTMGMNLGQHMLAALCAADAIASTSEFKSYERSITTDVADWPLRPVGGGAYKLPAGTPGVIGESCIVLARHLANGFEPLPFVRALKKRFTDDKVCRCPQGTANTVRVDDNGSAVYASRAAFNRLLEHESIMQSDGGALARNGLCAAFYSDSLHDAYLASMLHTITTNYDPAAVLFSALQTWMAWSQLNCQELPSAMSSPPDWIEGFYNGWADWLDDCPHKMIAAWVRTMGEIENRTGECQIEHGQACVQQYAVRLSPFIHPRRLVMDQSTRAARPAVGVAFSMSLWAWLFARGLRRPIRPFTHAKAFQVACGLARPTAGSIHEAVRDDPSLAVSALALFGSESPMYCAGAAALVFPMFVGERGGNGEIGLCGFDSVNKHCLLENADEVDHFNADAIGPHADADNGQGKDAT